MAKRPLFRCRTFLRLTRAPACPKQPRESSPVQPFLARLATFWKRDARDSAVKTFPMVVADRRAQVLQIAPSAAALVFGRPAFALPPFCITAAQGAVNFVEPPITEECQEALSALACLFWPGLAWCDIGKINGDDIRYSDFRLWMFDTFRCVFAGDVVGEPSFSRFALASAKSSANLSAVVEDDPMGGFVPVLACRSEP